MSAYLSACVRLPFCGYICLSDYLLETYQRIEPIGRQTHRQARIQIDIQTKMGNTHAAEYKTHADKHSHIQANVLSPMSVCLYKQAYTSRLTDELSDRQRT